MRQPAQAVRRQVARRQAFRFLRLVEQAAQPAKALQREPLPAQRLAPLSRSDCGRRVLFSGGQCSLGGGARIDRAHHQGESASKAMANEKEFFFSDNMKLLLTILNFELNELFAALSEPRERYFSSRQGVATDGPALTC